jgi:hypothetical protein
VYASEKIPAEDDRQLLALSQDADVDTEDRIELAARLLNQLLTTGLLEATGD